MQSYLMLHIKREKLRASMSSCVDEGVRKGPCRPAARLCGAAAALIRQDEGQSIGLCQGEDMETHQAAQGCAEQTVCFAENTRCHVLLAAQIHSPIFHPRIVQ